MWHLIVSLLFAQGVLTQAVTLVAKVSVGGVKGTVTFEQANPGEQVTVTLGLAGPKVAQVATWQLHAFRLNYDVRDRCSVAQLGPRILDSVGGLAGVADQTVSGVDLSGINSIEGRSVAFLNGGGTAVACATVESEDEYVTARATFRKTILGDIIFRQRKDSSSSLTRISADLYSDGSESSARDLEWRVVQEGGCSTVGTVYNPAAVTGVCDGSDHASCAVGDLQSKQGGVTVGVTSGSSRKSWSDLNLPLSGDKSVQGKTLQLFASGQSTPVACATILAYATRSGVATFDNDGVTGTITLTQPSPLDPTTTSVDLKNLRSKAGGYHVHKYPVMPRVSKDQSLCGAASVAGHFNPFEVVYDSSSPAAAASTEDMYEIGDLSKKYGLLSGSDMKSATYTDYNLPLFGTNSVMGRSLVIHYDQPNSPRWVCTNIHDTAALTSVLVTFTFPVIGHVLLQQRLGEAEAETSVYYRLDYGTGVIATTSDHSWAVHVHPVSGDMLSDDVASRCASAGDVLNPLGVSATNYATQCQPSDPLRCKMGDLKGKHRAVSIRAAAETPAIGFFTDLNLPLQGDNSVVGKSLVLKAAGGSADNLACANLLEVRPQVVEARSWGDTDYGSVTFTQQVGVVQAPTIIDINLKALSSHNTVSYSVRSLPVKDGQDDRCTSLEGVYNPFEVTSPGSSKDSIAVGDLTAKFGPMAGGSVSDITRVDPSLDVWGARAVSGRAFSLMASGRSVGCADIRPKVMSEGQLFTAKATFTGAVVGHIMLTQYMYKDGAMTPTIVVVDLRKAEGAQTRRHNWHTHEKTIVDDATAVTGTCSSTGGHYNPFKVDVKNGYSECKMTNPLRCELGDQSNKLGTYDMGSGPMVVNDVFLPLAGPYGVIGRSIVVHTENRGAPRLACADILPADITNTFLMSMKHPSTGLDKAPIVAKYAEAIDTATYNIAVKFIANRTNCMDVRVYFLGMEAEALSQKFNDMIGSGSTDAMGNYKPIKCDTGSANMVVTSLYLLLASLIIGHFLI